MNFVKDRFCAVEMKGSKTMSKRHEKIGAYLDFLHRRNSGENKYVTKKEFKTKKQQKEYKALAEQKRQRRCERNLRLKAKQES